MPNVQIRTLKRAVEILGGEEELAQRLNVAPNHLKLWIAGLALPPGEVFLDAADVVTEHELHQLMARKYAVPPEATDV